MTEPPIDTGAYETTHPAIKDHYALENLEMGHTAERVAERYDVSREAKDECAARSQQRAHEATESGRFDEKSCASRPKTGWSRKRRDPPLTPTGQ